MGMPRYPGVDPPFFLQLGYTFEVPGDLFFVRFQVFKTCYYHVLIDVEVEFLLEEYFGLSDRPPSSMQSAARTAASSSLGLQVAP